MPRSRASFSTNVGSTVSTLQKRGAVRGQRIMIRKIQRPYLGVLARGIEPADPGQSRARRRDAEFQRLIGSIQQKQQMVGRVVAIAEQDAQRAQIDVLPVILGRFSAAHVQPAHIFDSGTRGSSLEKRLTP